MAFQGLPSTWTLLSTTSASTTAHWRVCRCNPWWWFSLFLKLERNSPKYEEIWRDMQKRTCFCSGSCMVFFLTHAGGSMVFHFVMNLLLRSFWKAFLQLGKPKDSKREDWGTLGNIRGESPPPLRILLYATTQKKRMFFNGSKGPKLARMQGSEVYGAGGKPGATMSYLEDHPS